MGDHIVNGELVSIAKTDPTAKDLKLASNCLPTDWVMASMPDKSVVKLNDDTALPITAIDYIITPPNTYGASVCGG